MTRDSKLIEYKDLITNLIKGFEEITFTYLPREENHMVDALATLASMLKVNDQARMMPIRMIMTHCCNIEEEENDDLSWYYNILQYVKYQTYSTETIENDKQTLRRLDIGYVLDRDILHKKGRDQVLLRYVDKIETKKTLEEVHYGIYGTYANDFTIA
ncbi:uncharacterized protein LOC120170077 [Hibiscus syriacus]|uniref:uncharacterized protein LOC120170077 n=1 Tax=Hibiscus syriacus TaxID=106335 RepID=UPI0019229ABC|nr:uncharacterized protein LOC120170077 [Hibiscus syriacus]